MSLKDIYEELERAQCILYTKSVMNCYMRYSRSIFMLKRYSFRPFMLKCVHRLPFIKWRNSKQLTFISLQTITLLITFLSHIPVYEVIKNAEYKDILFECKSVLWAKNKFREYSMK